jgi:t-SNARE complex subunit (syntaxin)
MLRDAAASGDRRKALEELRNDLAEKLDLCESMRDYAALSQRLMDVLSQIDELTDDVAETKVTSLSDFEKRLRERDKAAKASRRAKSG